jgi:hypothetical protein
MDTLQILDNTQLFSELFQQIIFYAIISSVVIDGIKKTIKGIKKMGEEESLNRFVGLGLMYAFGFIASFFLKSELIVNFPMRLFFGIIIGSVGVACYDAVIKSVLGLIPNITKKIFEQKEK